jgi:hypothetical protein
MSTDDHWITSRITEAQTLHRLVTEAALSRMAELLKGQLSEQQLSHVDLTSVAKALIADMAPAPPKTDAKR